MKIPYTARTNVDVLRHMGAEMEMTTIRQQQMRFLEHVIRKNEMEAVVLTGMVEERRARERESKFMDGIM